MKRKYIPLEILECPDDDSPLEKRVVRVDFSELRGNILSINYCSTCKRYLKGEQMERDLKKAALYAYNNKYETKKRLKDIKDFELLKK